MPTVVSGNSTVVSKYSIMKRFLGIVIVTAFAVITSSAINCNNDICREMGTEHTMCKYPSSKPAAACGEVFSVGFTNEERREIIDAHNMRRSYVAKGLEIRGNPGPQPPASNMQVLFWDDELAEIAQRWANQCIFAYDECRNVDRFLVGQNAVRFRRDGIVTVKVSSAVDLWYKEVEDMDRNQVSRLTSTSGVSSYTQLVWAKTNRFGCGKILYKPDKQKHYFIVCNYGPEGNILNEPVYEIELQRNNLKNNVSNDMN